MIINDGIKEFISKIESDEPVPGGGSVSAAVGSFGSALALMYQNLSFNKKSFLSLDEDIQDRFNKVYEKLRIIKEELLSFVEEDAKAYDAVMIAYRLSKVNEEEKAIREKEIKKALVKATEVPLAIMETSLAGLKLLQEINGLGNKNAISDLGVAVLFLESSNHGAYLNVLINLGMFDTVEKEVYYNQAEKLRISASKIKDELWLEIVNEIIG